MSEHSELPWITFKQDNKIRIADSRGMCVTHEDEILWRQDAKYIVECCNNYEQVLAENKKLKEAFKQAFESKPYIPIVELTPAQKELIAENKKLKEALKKCLEYIKDTQETIDGEWGSCRDIDQLLKDEAMPQLYYDIEQLLKE